MQRRRRARRRRDEDDMPPPPPPPPMDGIRNRRGDLLAQIRGRRGRVQPDNRAALLNDIRNFGKQEAIPPPPPAPFSKKHVQSILRENKFLKQRKMYQRSKFLKLEKTQQKTQEKLFKSYQNIADSKNEINFLRNKINEMQEKLNCSKALCDEYWSYMYRPSFENGISQLSHDSLTRVFLYLDIEDISGSIPLVCKSWYEILKDDIFWQHLHLKGSWKATPTCLASTLKNFSSLFDFKRVFSSERINKNRHNNGWREVFIKTQRLNARVKVMDCINRGDSEGLETVLGFGMNLKIDGPGYNLSPISLAWKRHDKEVLDLLEKYKYIKCS